MIIYCAKPISGYSYDEVVNYYNSVKEQLETVGYEVLQPMTGKSFLRNEKKFRAEGYKLNPLSTNHAIKERDKWMVIKSDIVFVNFLDAKEVSIGCVSELAWADMLNKHTVVTMDIENDKIHNHCFVRECADIILPTLEESLEYLKTLYNQEI